MNKDQIKSMLQACELFSGLNAENIEQLLYQGEALRRVRGELLFSEGDRADTLYLLLTGSVQAYVTESSSKRYVLRNYQPGELIGLCSYVDEGPRSCNAVADGDCELLLLSRAALCEVFGSDDGLPECPKTRKRLMCHLVAVARQMATLARNLALLDVYGRVRILFNQMLVERDGEILLRKQLTQQEIADQIGSSREMVARILKELIYGHYIRIEQRRIVILKMLPENF